MSQPQFDPADPGPPSFLTVGEGQAARSIAWRGQAGGGSGPVPGAHWPGLVWLGGFKSDMFATKASHLAGFAAGRGQPFLRFDYSGHGESGGAFEEGTISQWLEDARAVIGHARRIGLLPRRVVFIGSSMGAHMALLAARKLLLRDSELDLAGMVLIAPAVDFTEALMWKSMPPHARAQVERDGFWLRPTPYADQPYPITRKLIEDGRRHLLLESDLRTHCRVHILQGMEDPDVPHAHAQRLVEHLAHDPVTLTLIRDGDHRLSRPQDLDLLTAAVAAMSQD